MPTFALVISSAILFEISDKVPTIGELWLGCLFLAALPFAIGLLRNWAVTAMATGILVPMAWWSTSEFRDPQMRDAYFSELGVEYVASAYVAAAMVVLAPSLGQVTRSMLRKRLQFDA